MRVNVKGVIIPQDYKRVYDWYDMESTTPKDVADALAAANGQPIEVYINSGGGYVHAGTDIYTALCEYPGEVNIKIIYAASAASVIAMAGHSMISPVGQMMIHNVYSGADGDYRALHRAGDQLDIACDALANAYMRKTGKTRDEIRAMMDAETWVDARRAVELGLVSWAATLSPPMCPDCCPKASCKRRLPCSAIRTPLLWRRPKPIMKILSKKGVV